MDEATRIKRTHIILHLLSSEDPKYPRFSFFCQLMKDTEICLNKASLEVSEDSIQKTIKEAVNQFVLDYESRWQEIMGSWYSCDIYEMLKVKICKQMIP